MATTRREITTLVRRYVAALEARGIPVERVILFGSHAFGRAHAWSDIDLAVISATFDSMSLLERYEQLGLASRDLRAPLQVVGFSPAQVANYEPESFLAEILATGIEVPPPADENCGKQCWQRCGEETHHETAGDRVS